MWVSSREFAESFNANKKSLEKACFRANQRGKKICTFRHNIICFIYAKGIGYAGKILQIWNTPLSKKQIEVLEKGYPVKYVLEEMGEAVECAKVDKVMDCFRQSPHNDAMAKCNVCKSMDCHEANASRNDKATQPNVMESMDSKTLDCKGIDNEKTSQNIQGETLHTRGIDCASKHYCGTTSSSNSTIYRNDLSACAIKDEVITSCNKEEIQSSKDNLTTWHNLTSKMGARGSCKNVACDG